jgi:hypothetical protein
VARGTTRRQRWAADNAAALSAAKPTIPEGPQQPLLAEHHAPLSSASTNSARRPANQCPAKANGSRVLLQLQGHAIVTERRQGSQGPVPEPVSVNAIVAIAAVAAIWALSVLSLALSLPQGFWPDDSEAKDERGHRTHSKASVGHSGNSR